MIVVYCDKCKEKMDTWAVRILSTKWHDDSGSQIAEICDRCLRELIFIIDPKKYKTEYGAYETSDKFTMHPKDSREGE